MKLKDTIELMQSEDYKERFMAEYHQLIIRYKKLKKMYDNWDNLSFVPRCPKSIYKMQLEAMNRYLAILEARAAIEEVPVYNSCELGGEKE